MGRLFVYMTATDATVIEKAMLAEAEMSFERLTKDPAALAAYRAVLARSGSPRSDRAGIARLSR